MGFTLVKLKLTAWAEERIKNQLDTFTTTDLIVDPEVKAAYETGFIDLGDEAQAMFTKDGKSIHILKRGMLRAYSRKTWQVYNSPKRAKK